MSLFRRGGVWYIDLWRAGRPRLRQTTGTSDRERAQRIHDEAAARLWQERDSGRFLTDALTLWLESRPRSRQELTALKQLRDRYADRPLSQVTDGSFLERFGALKPSTYNRLANVLRAALRAAENVEWCKAPTIRRRKEEPTDFRALTPAEWKRLHAELPEHLQPMAAFAIATGLRWANVSGLQWEHVDLKRKLAWVHASRAKGRKSISVPLSRDAIAALRRAGVRRNGYVFTYEGEPIGSAKTAWRKATARAGLDGFRWHDLRHTWASWHVQNGTPLAVLKELGAWADLKMVQRYAHLGESHVAQYADNARPKRAA